MSLKHRIILSLRSVAPIEDIERVVQVKRPPKGASDRIVDVWIHVVHYAIEVFGKEKLADVGEFRRLEEGVVGILRTRKKGPIGEDLCVNMRRSTCIVSGEDR